MHVLRASEVAAAMTRIMMLRPDRHTADGPVFSVIPHGSVQAFIPLPGVTASFQRPGEMRLDGPVLAGAHTLATLCRVWANGPVAVVPLSNRTLVRHGVVLPQLSARLTGISQQLAMALCRAEETAPDRARGCGDVVFLQDGQRWSSLPDRLIEVREAPWLLAQDIWLQE